MKENEIYIIQGRETERMALELCIRAGLSDMIRKTCGSDPLICIKPNLVGPIPASDGATTHPEIIRGIVGYLRQQGFCRIAVMESSWVGDDTEDSLLVTGYGELCRELDVPFWNLEKDKGVWTDCAGMRLMLCEKALQADFLINAPVLKGHCQTGMTCALKNMKGCIPSSEKRRFHRMGLHEPIGHLSAGIRQHFILADAVCPDLTFEDGGNPTQMDMLLCAADPVLLDAFGTGIVGLEMESVPYIGIAQRCGVGCADTGKAQITSLLERRAEEGVSYVEAADAAIPSGASARRSLVRVKEVVEDVDSCSACYASLIPALQKLGEEGLLDRLKDGVCIGQGWRGKSGSIGVGQCTSHFEHTLAGCPPTCAQMYSFLKTLTYD